MTTRLLTLVRHAEAGAEHGSRIRDCDRLLTERGRADAKRLGARLAAMEFEPDSVWASDAQRALATATILAKSLALGPAVLDVRPSLYLAHSSVLCDRVREASDGVRHLAIVGHNPGLSEVWDWLCDKNGFGLPTCGVARLELEIGHWHELERGCAQLIDFQCPEPEVASSGC